LQLGHTDRQEAKTALYVYGPACESSTADPHVSPPEQVLTQDAR
jgi:hypothetical protein